MQIVRLPLDNSSKGNVCCQYYLHSKYTGVSCTVCCVFSLTCVRFIVHYIIILHWNWVPLYEKRDQDLTYDWLSDERRWILTSLKYISQYSDRFHHGSSKNDCKFTWSQIEKKS